MTATGGSKAGLLLGLGALVLAAACDRGSGGAAPSATGRVDAVKAKSPPSATPSEVCDRYFEPGQGPVLQWPELAEDKSPPRAEKGRWMWINLWATWCKPCVQEMPLVDRWARALDDEGDGVDLVLVSADDDDAAVSDFLSHHSSKRSSLRLADPEHLASWLEALGIPGASLPVHLWVEPDGHLRCARASALSESDRARVELLLSSKP